MKINRRFLINLLSGYLLWSALTGAAIDNHLQDEKLVLKPVDREHPFLFTTQQDIETSRQAIRNNPDFAAIGKRLIEAAKAADINTLPKFERDWWEKEKHKDYREVYNPDFLTHTHLYFTKYAGMARQCARAHLLEPLRSIQTSLSIESRN